MVGCTTMAGFGAGAAWSPDEGRLAYVAEVHV